MREVRVVNPDTGGEKGAKVARFSLIPVEPLMMLASHYGIGGLKYEDDNWQRGYDWRLSYDALQRHANAWWSGEEWGEEEFVNRFTGEVVRVTINHMIAVAWHAFALYWFSVHKRFDSLMPSQFASDFLGPAVVPYEVVTVSQTPGGTESGSASEGETERPAS